MKDKSFKNQTDKSVRIANLCLSCQKRGTKFAVSAKETVIIMLNERIIKFFADEKIEYYAHIPADGIRVINPSLQKRKYGGETNSLIVMLVPYLVRDEGSISQYARGLDYHLFFDSLFAHLIPLLKKEYPDNLFAAFADSSPFDERDAAAKAGLGVRGENSLIINEKFGSYVFLGEIVTDMICSEKTNTPKRCIDCGACKAACPSPSLCLSALSQKKSPDEKEKALLKENGIVWGCDICQTVCPMNKNAAETPIDFFRKDRVCFPDADTIEKMSEGEFSARAYSWKGRETILGAVKR